MGGLSIAIEAWFLLVGRLNGLSPRLLSRKSGSTKISSGDSHPCGERAVVYEYHDKTVHAVEQLTRLTDYF
jgi:hypothetical protein